MQAAPQGGVQTRTAYSSNCPTGSSPCRYADAAFISFSDVGADNRNYQFGPIYKTSGPNNGSTYASGYFSITDDIGWPGLGQSIAKIGHTSGWTTGLVVQTCVHVAEGNGYLLCQILAHYVSLDGDSGAPVFYQNGSSTVSLDGLKLVFQAIRICK